MAETDPVKIAVEIVSSVEDDIAEIKGQLESLGRDIDVDVDVGDNGDIESLQAQKEMLRKGTRSVHKFEGRGFGKLMAQKEALQGTPDDMIDLMQMRGQEALADLGGQTEVVRGMKADLPDTSFKRLPGLERTIDTDFSKLRPPSGLTQDWERVRGQMLQTMRSVRNAQRTIPGGGFAMAQGVTPDTFGFEGGMPELDIRELGGMRRAVQSPTRFDLPSALEANRKSFRRTLGVLDKLRPNIMQVWNFLAALIPVMIVLAGAAIGLAGALIAVGTAAAGIIGVGLLGWGKDLESSFENAQQAAQDMKEELFTVLQPAAAEMQPILQDWMEGAPRQVERLVGPLQELTELRDEVESAGVGFVDWIGRVMESMASMDAEIGTIISDFGTAFGNFLISFMENFTQFAADNSQQIIMLAGSIRDLFGAIFNLAVIAGFVIGRFGFLLEILDVVAGMLSNEFVQALLTGVTAFYLLQGAIVAAGLAKSLFASTTAAETIPVLGKLITMIWSATSAYNALYAAILRVAALTGVGLALAGVGAAITEAVKPDSPTPNSSIGGGRGGMGGGGTTINVQGDVGDKEMNKLVDKMPEESRSEISAQNRMG